MEEEEGCCILEKDFPLGFDFKVKNAEEIEARLIHFGLPEAPDVNYGKARISIFSEAVRASEADKYVSYSRRKNFYSGAQRYKGLPYSYNIVTRTIDQAVELGLLEEIRAKPGAHLEKEPRQSKIRATESLIHIFRNSAYESTLNELIWLRGENRRLLDYEDTDKIKFMRSQLEKINEFLSTIRLELPDLSEHRVGKFIKFEDKYVFEGQLQIFRSFCRGSFDYGGRCYGWFQNLPKKTRLKLRINGAPVVEVDYSQFHPTLIYAENKIQIPPNWDPYCISGFDRDDVKTAFNIAVNAKNTHEARGAIEKKCSFDVKDAARLVREIKSKHDNIKNMFCSDYGVKLMRIDSEIIIDVMNDLINKNIPFLPIHDSVVCNRINSFSVEKIMEKCFSKKYPSTKCSVKIKERKSESDNKPINICCSR